MRHNSRCRSNTKVQVISRSWKRETWAARATTALVKCPSADMSRGWVVATEHGKLLTTGKLFPSVDQGKVSFSSTGSLRWIWMLQITELLEKRAARQLQTPMIGEPVHGADKLAKKLYEGDLFRPGIWQRWQCRFRSWHKTAVAW